MLEPLALLKELTALPGLSGYEQAVCQYLTRLWQPLTDEIKVSPLGSLHALRRGCGSDPRPAVLLAAHMDVIGLMVSKIDGEFLHVTRVGGIDARVLAGQLVTVHGKRDLPGILALTPASLLPPGRNHKNLQLEDILVDTGLTAGEVKDLIPVGSLVSFARPPLELNGDMLAAPGLDNRASLAALTLCAQELQHMTPAWDVWLAATVQEEVTLAGGATSPFALRPAMAIAVDVTFGKGPGTPDDYRSFPLGKGVALGLGANIHPKIHQAMKNLAEKLEIPVFTDLMPGHSGTDAFAMQIVAGGIPTVVVEIPLRNMHTPVEVIALRDVSRTARLLAEFIARLSPEFVDSLKWNNTA